MTDALFVLTLALLLLSPLAIAGVALINTGLGRSRSAAQSLLGCLAILAVTAVVFAILGASLTGSAGGPSFSFWISGKPWSFIGAAPLFLAGLDTAQPQAQLALLAEFFAVALAGLIAWGSGADRLRLSAGIAIAAVLAAVVFPLLAHWIWAGGWLAQLGDHFGLGAGFQDPGGAATIHALGGISALAIIWITGSRKGKFPKEGLSTAMPGHNAVYVLFGSLLSFIGWMAFNLSGAILWLHTPASALAATAINTLLSASAAVIATFVVTRIRFGKPDASLCANGWLCGLVASSASAALVPPAAALFIGLVAGIATPLLVELFELALSIDDPTGAVTVHAIGALWGLFAAGLFSSNIGQFTAQLVGISALLGFFFPLIYLLFGILNRFVAFRVNPDGERIGMDLDELGGGAYPEFVIHRDESYR
jgi:Amt family ammonium transporter